jgi:hypothetical protein
VCVRLDGGRLKAQDSRLLALSRWGLSPEP